MNLIQHGIALALISSMTSEDTNELLKENEELKEKIKQLEKMLEEKERKKM